MPTYVEYGAADIGVAGKDVLMEYPGDGLYEPLDLDIARCRMMVCGFPDAPPPVGGHLRIATKYLDVTRRYFAAKGEQVELIKLYGSMELAPIVGLADRIADLVETGNTLKANGLIPLELIAQISSRLVVGKAAMKTKNASIKRFVRLMGEAVEQRRRPTPPTLQQPDYLMPTMCRFDCTTPAFWQQLEQLLAWDGVSNADVNTTVDRILADVRTLGVLSRAPNRTRRGVGAGLAPCLRGRLRLANDATDPGVVQADMIGDCLH